MILVGDCFEHLRGMGDCSVDAVVTDPPYELGFMGKAWDSSGVAYRVDLWGEVLRVLKPGGHLLAFGGSRTYHRLACAVEDAGFEIRDQIMWVYGSGFPKSLDVSKAIDKRGGVHAGFVDFRDAVKNAMKRSGVSRAQLQDALGNFMLSHYLTSGSQPAVPNLRDYRIIRDTVGLGDEWDHLFEDEAAREVVGTAKTTTLAVAPGQGTERLPTEVNVTAPATDAAKQWSGWGTALKPAHEPIVVARKPITGTVARNVLEHGTGAINIDACRIGTDNVQINTYADRGPFGDSQAGKTYASSTAIGRWPANLIHDGSDEVLEHFPDTKGGIAVRRNVGKPGGNYPFAAANPEMKEDFGYGDSGSAARFFYCAKAGRAERNAGLDVTANHHPTVKPVALMRYLVRLVTPPDGVVFDPFLGSGTTAVAAILEGNRWVGCELTEEYVPIIEGRVAWAEANRGML